MATHKSASANGKYNMNMSIGFSIDQASYNKTLQSLKKLQNITQDDVTGKTFGSKSMQNQIDRIKQSAAQIQKIWKQAFNSDLGTLNIQKFNSLLNSSGINLKKLGKDWASTGAIGASAFRNLTTATITANMNLKKTDGLINKMGTTFLNTIKWTFASSVINNFTGSLQQSFGYIKSLDSSLNDIRIVTGKSADEMSKFAVKANEAAKALGKQTTDYTNAALIYYQQGLGEEESNTLAETTLKVSNITGQSAKTVSEEITAVMNGYQLGADQVEGAFDSLAAVAATTASDLSEISTGMSKVASTANMLGVPLDSLNAQLATIVSVTRQAPESVGTALKTIYARMNDLKLGKSDEDGIQLGDVSGSLEKMGIHILDEKKNLRDLGTVINEVAASWKTWTDEQKIAMAESLAGKRQYNNLIALFDNWDMYTKALNTSLTAQGTIAKQNGIYLDSLAAHMNQLKTAQEGVMDSFFDSKSFKGFIDFGTSALGVLEKIIDALGGGGTILANIAAIVGRVFGKQISKEISNIVINLQNYKYNLQQIQSASENLQKMKEMGAGIKDAGANKIIELKEQINSMGDIATPEQQNQANAILNRINDLHNERDAWKQNYNAHLDYLKLVGQDIDATKLLAGEEEDLKTHIDATKQSLAEKQKQYSKYLKNVAKLQLHRKDQENQEEPKESYNFKNKGLQNDILSLQNSEKILQEVFNGNTAIAERFFKAVKKGTLESDNDINYMIQLLKNIKAGFKDSENAIEGAVLNSDKAIKKSMESLQIEWNQLVNSMSTTKIVKNITDLVSSTGQAAAGFQTLSNITNIWANDSINIGQKLIQTFTNIGFALPQIISGLTGMHKVLAGIGAIKIGISNNLFNKLKAGLEDDSLKKSEKSLTGYIIKKKLANLLKSQGEELTGKETLAQLAKIVVDKVERGEINKLTVAHLALNAAMLAGPAIIFAVIAALSALAKANKAAKEKEAEAATKQLENSKELLEKKKEQRNKIEELATSYDKLYKQYKKHEISLSEMRSSTYDLCKQYGDYNLIVKALAGSFDDLDEALRKIQLNKNDEAIAAAEKTSKDAVNSVRTQANLLNADHQIYNAGIEDGSLGVRLRDNGDSKEEVQKKIEFLSKYLKLTGAKAKDKEGNVLTSKDIPRLVANGETFGLDFAGTEDTMAKNSDEINQLFANYSKYINQSIIGVTSKFNDNIKDVIGAHKDALDTAKQAHLENILISDDTTEKRDAVKDQETFEKYYEGIIKQARQYFETEEQAKEWASKKLLEDESLRKFSYVDKIKDSIGGDVSQEMKDYLNSLSEEELSLIISGQIEFLGKDGPDALKQGLQLLKQQLTPEDTTLAINMRAEVAKGGQLKEDDIKSLSAQTGVEAGVIKDDLDSGSALDRLERYEAIVSKINQDNIEYLTMSKEKAQEESAIITDKLKKLEEQRKQIQDRAETSEEAKKAKEEQLKQIDEEIAKYDTLSKKYKQIQDGLNLEDIDTANFDIINNQIDSVITKTKALKSAAEMIGEGFKVAAGDVEQFAELYPELTKQATINAEGQLELNQQLTQDFLNRKKQEIEADAKAKEAQLNSQIAIYEARVELDESSLQSLQAYLKGEQSAEKTKEQLSQSYGVFAQKVNDTLGKDNENLTVTTLENMQLTGKGFHDVLQTIVHQVAQVSKQIALMGKGKSLDIDITGEAIVNKSAQQFAKDNNIAEFRTQENLNDGAYDQAMQEAKDIANRLKHERDYLNSLYASKAKLQASTSASIAALEGAASGRGGKSSSSGGGSSKDPETKDHKDYSDKAIKDERDIYLQIDRIIKDTQKHLEKLEKTTEKLVGEDLAKALQEQNKILAQQSANYEKKAELAKKEQERLAEQLSQQGFTFGENGELNNYNAAYTANADRINKQIQAIQDETNAAIDSYNSLSAAAQQQQKENIETIIKNADARVQALKAEWTALTTNVSQYNKAIDDVEENEKLAQQALEKQYENMVTLFKEKIKVTLDFNDAKREYQKFVRDVVKNFSKETAKGLGVMLDTSAAELDTYLNKDNGDAITYQNQLNTATGALERMKASGADRDQVTHLTQKEAEQMAQEASKGLMSSLTSAKDKIQELYDAWLEGYDKIQEQFSKQVKKYQFINNLLDHDVKLVNLLYGDKAYDLLDKYYDKQIQNDNQKLELLKEQASFNEKNMLAAQKQLEGLQEGTKEYEQAERRYEATQNAWMESINNLNSAIEDSLNRIIEKYNNAWNQAIDKSIKKLTDGRSLENIAEEWQLIKKNADMYYDDINKGFEIEKTALAYDKAISGLQGNINAQKRLNALKEQEINKLKQKEKITKYDVERANALLDLEQKKIALEEAQKNKSKLRLRRDSQGNYSYQYTTDEQDTENKQSDYLNSMQNVYNLDRQAYRDNLDAQLQATTEYYNKKRELAEAYRQGDESALEKMKYLDEQYQTYITNLAEENTGIRINLLESTGESAEAVYKDEKASFKSMAEGDRQQLMTVLVPGWTGAIQTISNKINGGNGEKGFIPFATELTGELVKITNTYTTDLSKLQTQAGVSFPAVDEGVGKVSETTQGLVKQTETFIKDTDDLLIKVSTEKDKLDELKRAADSYTQSLKDMVGPADTAIIKWQDLQQGIVDATNKASLAIQTIGNAAVSAANEISSVSAAAAVARSNASSGGSNNGGGSSNYGGSYTPSESASTPEPTPQPAGRWYLVNHNSKEVLGGPYSTHGEASSDLRFTPEANDVKDLAGEDGWVIQGTKYYDMPSWAQGNTGSYQRSYITFASGGYTGQWANGNKDGRLAMLHQKELILNAEDTKNILSAVDIVRTMRDALNFITSDSSLPNFAKNLASMSSSSQLEQNVHITATFPNVVDRNEIQIALENLTSKASQYINRH